MGQIEGEDIVLLFTVEDSGIGIQADKLTSIFESFTQADNDIARKYGGTGLGLITKRLIEQQGGKIWVTSKIGQGFIFYFKLPVKQGAMSISEPVSLPLAQENHLIKRSGYSLLKIMR